MWAYSGMAPHIGPHLRLSSQSSDGKGLASRLDLAGSEWKGESESNRPSFFLKAFRRQTSFFLRHPASSKKPPVNITLLDLPLSQVPSRAALKPPLAPQVNQINYSSIITYTSTSNCQAVLDAGRVQTDSLAYRTVDSFLSQTAERRHHLLAALNFDPAAEQHSKRKSARAPDLTSLPSIRYWPLYTVRIPCNSIPPKVKSEE
jgi:hypothetical protein